MSLLGGRFGSVDKAAFQIGMERDKEGVWKFSDPIEVLFNPSMLKVTSTVEMRHDEGVANEKTNTTIATDRKTAPKGFPQDQVEMTLLFNIVEAYNKKTAGADFIALKSSATSLAEKLFNGQNVMDSTENALMNFIAQTDYSDLSILNPALCCYPALRIATHAQVKVIFQWGNLWYEGFISTLQTTFNYFSSQGAPLGAEVRLVMTCTPDDKKHENASSVKLKKMVEGIFTDNGKIVRVSPGAG